MDAFKHEGQEVYQAALELVTALDRLTRTFSPNREKVAEQLMQGSVTIVRDTAAGLGLAGGEGILRDALGTTLQLAGSLDVARTLRLTDEDSIALCRQLTLRLAGLLYQKTGGGKTERED